MHKNIALAPRFKENKCILEIAVEIIFQCARHIRTLVVFGSTKVNKYKTEPSIKSQFITAR